MAYYGNDEDYEDFEPYEDDDGSELDQQIEQEEQELIEAQAAQKQTQELEEKLLSNKLKQIIRTLSVGSRTSLKVGEKKTMKDAKKFPKLKPLRKSVETLLNVNRGKNTMKMMSSSPALFYVALFAMLLVVIIAVVVSLSSMFGVSDGGGASAVAGITGTDFYGARMVYKDDDKSTEQIIQDYVTLVEDGIATAKNTELINVKININLTIPNEDFSYSEFDETTFKSSYSELFNTIENIAKLVNTKDNGTLTGTTFEEIISNVKYFGLVDVDADNSTVNDATEIIYQAILNNSTFENAVEGGEVQDADVNTAKEKILTELTTLYDDEKYLTRSEKLFVKDYILEGDQMMSNIAKENYVAFIFMSRKDVEFSKISFSVSNADFTNFNMSLNGDELTTDGANLGMEEGQNAFLYSANITGNLHADKFADIDENNLSALSEGLSLNEIIKNLDETIYLEAVTTEGENAVTYLTFKQNGVAVLAQNNEAFNLVEFETAWEAAS